MLQSRCTDDTGAVQPSIADMVKIWSLPANYFETFTGTFGNLNLIQPWRVMRDGSVHNALLA